MIIFLDTETTGLYPGNICQLSYILQDGDKVSAKNLFFAVDFVEFGAFMVHGFSVERLQVLSNGKRFCDYAKEIYLDFSSADLIITHNTSFDFMFLRKEFERLGMDFEPKNSFCSMKNMTAVCKLQRSSGRGYKYPKLSELCAFFDISDDEILAESKKIFGEKTGYHDARFDTTAVYLAVNKGLKVGLIDCGVKEYL